MKRVNLAMALGFGLALAAGCGGEATDDKQAASEGLPAKPAANAAANNDAPPAPPAGEAGGAALARPGGGGPGGPSAMPPGYGPPPGTTGPAGKPVEDAKTDDAKKDDAKKEEGKADDAKKEEPKKEEPKTAGETLNAEEIAAINKLPEADRKAALAQKVCLVGGDHLGAMGAPVKKVVKGKTVFLCCDSCSEDLEKNPDKYLAKLPK